jgi:hypothetical protein
MAESEVRCVLVKIHGIGNQKRTWSRRFDGMLKAKLATLSRGQQRRFVSESVWWADLSRLPGMAVAAAAGRPVSASADVAFSLVQQEYTQYLLTGNATTGGVPAAFGLPLPNPTKIIARLKDVIVRAADNANDVANYVTNNGVRLQIQHRLSDKLFQMQAKYPNASLILGSHSQGTVVSYDVLRLNGSQLPSLKTWITMGSPLAWYLSFLRWGDDPVGIPSAMTWLNFYDDDDRVGKTLQGLVSWPAPVPVDIDVDNKSKGLDAHDHWHNPDVVERYFELIGSCLTR